jgi:hypothetical protein
MTQRTDAMNRTEVVGLLLAAAGDVRVPARCWPLEVALYYLATSDLCHTLQASVCGWNRTDSLSGSSYGAEIALRELAVTGHLRAEGRGWEAGYRLHERSARTFRRRLSRLCPRERSAIHNSVSQLQACLTTWSKNAVVPTPSASSTT